MIGNALDFTKAVWAEFEARGVKAVLPRKLSQLSQDLGGDIDIFVRLDDKDCARDAIQAVAKNEKWRVCFEDEVANHHHLVFWRDEGTHLESVHVDLQNALGRKGFFYALSEPFISGAAREGNISIPSISARALALALHMLLDKGEVKEAYRESIMQDMPESLGDFAKAVLPRSCASEVVEWVRAGMPDKEVPYLQRSLRRALRIKYPSNLGCPLVIRIGRWLRFFGPRRGVLIAFLGPDGAGKSTILEETCRRIPQGPYPVISVYMGKRIPFLPTSHLIRFFFKRGSIGKGSFGTTNNQGETMGFMDRVKDILGLINWILEQWARYLIKIRPYLQQGGVVLTDRYAFDLANRPSGSLAYHPKFLRALKYVFPLPDYTYLLWEKPEVLFTRKNVLSREESAVILERLRHIVRNVPNHQEIRTNERIEITAANIARNVAILMEGQCPH